MGYPGGGGFGILEILLLAGIGFFVFRWFMNRSLANAGAYSTQGQGGPEMGYGANQSPWGATASAAQGPGVGAAQAQTRAGGEPEAVAAIQRYDASFDPRGFKDSVMDGFFAIQAAWSKRDLAPVRGFFTPAIYGELENQLGGLRSQGRINRLENIAVREIELVEAWQELGKEYVTARFYANLLDYTVDDRTGQVVDGDNSKPVKFEEYWTYVRDVGAGKAWQLTAVENP